MSRILPILFNTEMVRAILDGRKTVTRRLIKPQQLIGLLPDKCKNGTPNEFLKEKKYMFKPYCDMTDAELIKAAYNLPYHPGNILYVRESGIIQSMKNFDSAVKIYFPADDSLVEFKVSPEEYERLSKFPEGKKLSPYWLTKQESRIWLKVKDVRVKRLQDMDEDDAFAEGVSPWDDRCYANNGWKPTFFDPDSGGACCPLDAFEDIWNSTIKKSDLDRYGWAANPWVWVIEFEQTDKPEEK